MIGCGAVGLNVLQGAKLVDAGQIIAVDVGEAKLDRARLFGATHAVDATAAMRSTRSGRSPTAAAPTMCSRRPGNKTAFRLAVEAVRPGGQVVWLGKVNVNEDVSFRWGSLMGEKRIVRSSYGDARPRRDFPWLVREYLDGQAQARRADHPAHRPGRDQRRLRRLWRAAKASAPSSCSTGRKHACVDACRLKHPPLAAGHDRRAAPRRAQLGDLELESRRDRSVDYRQSYVTHGDAQRRHGRTRSWSAPRSPASITGSTS